MTIMERLALYQILPKEGDIVTIKTIRQLRNKLEFTDQETEEFELSSDDAGIRWNPKKNRDVPIEITEPEASIVRDVLKKLNDRKALTENLISLYDRFVV